MVKTEGKEAFTISSLAEKIDKWCEEHSNIDIVDIKYQPIQCRNDSVKYTALIIYKTK
jgi:hypothetical protein